MVQVLSTDSTFTFQLLHASDFEAAIPALQDAPRFSAVLNALKNQDNNGDSTPDYTNTLILSSGDNYIPGVWSSASNTIYGSPGRADIKILNELGIQVSTFGNHEFDFGTGVVRNVFTPDATKTYEGLNFPYLSANLDFNPEDNLNDFITADGQEASTIPGKIAKSTIITVNGEKIGIIGGTTPILKSISSTGNVGVSPADFDANDPNDIKALADILQASVDQLLQANPDLNKVILSTHMQQLGIEQALAPNLRNVDIIVAGGSHTRLLDANDRLRAGDTKQGDYPIFTTGLDGNPIAIVNTDANYKYVGRLVIDFDANGVIIPTSYDPNISGAYATDDQGVADLNGTPDPEIVAITQALQAQINALESQTFGVTNFYLNGNRAGTGVDGVRNQETNLGNLTADANLEIAQDYDPAVTISIKNGGGIRNSIGQIVVVGTEDPMRLPPAANALTGKPDGGISQLDIGNALSFNNGLTLVTLNAAQLLQILEHGVSDSTNDPTSSQGRFPQVSGVAFSYDLNRPNGDRIISAAIKDENDGIIDVLARNGDVVGDPNRTFRIVTLGFLADGGDAYPFNTFDPQQTNRRDLTSSETDPRTGIATFAADGSEQDALAEYLAENFPTTNTAFNQDDVPRTLDTRIQNLAFRSDAVFNSNAAVGIFNLEQLSRSEFGGVISINPVFRNNNPLTLLFDETYYLSENPDVQTGIINGTFGSGYEHYINFGVNEQRNPSTLYNENFYLTQNPDVANAVNTGIFQTGFEHYVTFGQLENRDPSALFDGQDYLTNNPDVVNAIAVDEFQSGFEHYILSGLNENRLPSLALYNEGYYLSQNPDVATAVADKNFMDGFDHYIQFGQGEQRNPSSLFNENQYLATYSDVANAVNTGVFQSGFQHYILSGRAEERLTLI
jgi:2',3'-cyclic-nucleotide 2'-phosphodiesterase (5'-nucleotidase family)